MRKKRETLDCSVARRRQSQTSTFNGSFFTPLRYLFITSGATLGVPEDRRRSRPTIPLFCAVGPFILSFLLSLVYCDLPVHSISGFGISAVHFVFLYRLMWIRIQDEIYRYAHTRPYEHTRNKKNYHNKAKSTSSLRLDSFSPSQQRRIACYWLLLLELELRLSPTETTL